jgi:hypothetical protein
MAKYHTGSPAFGPSVWKSIGRQRLSSFIKLEFWKCAIRAAFPWIRAYARDATFSLLNFSHFLPLNACKRHVQPQLVSSFHLCEGEFISYIWWGIHFISMKNINYYHPTQANNIPYGMEWSVEDQSCWWMHSPHCICSVKSCCKSELELKS